MGKVKIDLKTKVWILSALVIFVAAGISYLKAQTAGSISGTVYDFVTQQPIPNATVSTFDPNTFLLKVSETNDKGEYILSDLPAGKYNLRVAIKGYSKAIQKVVELNVGETKKVQNIFLKTEGRISGIIADKAGNSVEGATIMASSSDGKSDGIVNTSAQGNYEMGGLEQGIFSIEVLKDGFLPYSRENISAMSGSTTSNVNFILSKAAIIKGKVANDTNSPINGASLKLTGNVSGFTKTNSQGEYEFRNLPSGVYKVIVKSMGFLPADHPEINLSEGQMLSLNIVLKLGGSVTGRVTEPDGITPIADIDVGAVNGLSSLFLVKTDSNGNFRIVGLPSGAYNISLLRVSGTILATINSITVKEGEETKNINFVLAKPGSISGMVTKQDAITALEGAVVHAVQADGDGNAISKTSSDGRFLIESLPPGSYTVKAYADGFQFGTQERVLVEPNKRTDNIEFHLLPQN